MEGQFWFITNNKEQIQNFENERTEIVDHSTKITIEKIDNDKLVPLSWFDRLLFKIFQTVI